MGDLRVWDFSQIRFAPDTGPSLPRRQRLLFRNLVASDSGEEIIIDGGGVLADLTANLETKPITSGSQIVFTDGYSAASDGGAWLWKGVLGGTADPDDYAQIATTNGYWQAVPDGNKVNVRALGAGFGGVDDALRIRSAWTLAGQGGEVIIPEANYTWNDLITFTPLDYQKITGVGRALIRRVNAYGAMDFRGRTGITCTGIEIAMDYFQPFVRIFDCTEGASYITIRDCIAYQTEASLSGVTTLGHTLHAVLCDGSSNITVESCRFKYLQCKMTITGSTQNIRVERCYIDNPIDYACSVATSSAGADDCEIKDIIIRGNIVNNPRHSGVFYVGADSESGRIAVLHRVAVEDNVVNQDVNLAGVQILVHLGDDSQDISICRNQLRNADTTLSQNSSLIRVRANNEFSNVDGLRISENLLYGADLYGINCDVTGRNIQIQNNNVRNTAGIWIRALEGDVKEVLVSGNVAGYRRSSPYYFEADGGSITGLRLRNNVAIDPQGLFERSSGFVFTAAAGYSISADVHGCIVDEVDTTGLAAAVRPWHFAWHKGAGTVNVRYVACDGSAVQHNFVRHESTGGAVTGFGNIGTNAPNSHPSSRSGTVTISGASTSAAVSFTMNENDSSYFPVLSVAGISGAAVVTTPYPTAIATTGFTVNVPTAPGVGTTVTIRWEVSRS